MAISTAVLLLLSTWTAAMERRFCDPRAWGTDLAGGWATGCGEFGPSEDRTSAIDCMLRAQAEGRPAWAMLWEQGIDSAVGGLFVRTPDGATLLLNYDSDPSGGARFKPHLRQRQCSKLQEELVFNKRHSFECVDASQPADVCGSD